MNNTEKAQVGQSIFFAIISLVVFYVCSFVLTIVLSFVFGLLINLPLISTLIGHLFRLRGDSPAILITLVSAGLSYYAVVWVLNYFNKIKPTVSLSLIIFGVILLVLNTLFLIINIVNGYSFLSNIVVIIVGIISIIRGRAGEA